MGEGDAAKECAFFGGGQVSAGCRCHAAVVMARPTSLREAPSVSSDFTSRSIDTDASAASM
jgi:hypothetical protein